jgi:plasmid stabilization system protein ParE
MDRCRRFLSNKDRRAAQRAARVIADQLERLEDHPEIGRPFPDAAEMRELIIPFGDAGHVALYRYDRAKDIIVVLAFRHQREAGYRR